jgi:hypothetical protein
VDQVSDAVGKLPHIRLGLIERKRSRGASVAILANQRVDLGLFAEALNARREDEQFASIGNCHAGSVNRLVGHPRGAKLIGLHHGDNLLQWLVKKRDVLVATGTRGFQVRFEIVPHIDAARDQLVMFIPTHDDL